MKFLPLYAALLTVSSLSAMEIDTCFLNQESPHCFDLEVDYLLWYANQGGMAFATQDTLNISSGNQFNNQRDQFLKTKWDSGVRASFGFKPSNRSWDIRLVDNYFMTRIQQKPVTGTTFTNFDNILGSSVIPDYVPVDAFVDSISRADSLLSLSYRVDPEWKLHFNSLDLELGNDFNFFSNITFRPFFGVRGLWTHQHFQENISITSISDISGILTQSLTTAFFTQKSTFSGVGAKAGFGLNYSLWKGLHLYGDLAAGILWGWFNVRQKVQKTIQNFSLVTNPSEKFNHSHQSSVFNFDIHLGLEWNFLLNANRNSLTFKFGWEQHLFSNMNQFQQFIQATQTSELTVSRNVNRGDLSLSGFSFGLNYSF